MLFLFDPELEVVTPDFLNPIEFITDSMNHSEGTKVFSCSPDLSFSLIDLMSMTSIEELVSENEEVIFLGTVGDLISQGLTTVLAQKIGYVKKERDNA